MNYYKRHIGDYAKDTRFLSTYQHGVYALFLDWYYSNEKPIPMALAYRIVQARSGPERRAVDEVLSAFFDVTKGDGFAHNKRADLDIAKYRLKGAANSLIAQEAWDAKRMQDASETHDERYANDIPSHKPLTTNHKEAKEKTPTPAAPVDFKADVFARWKALPDGGGGGFLNKLLRDHKPEQRVLDAIARTLDDVRADPKSFVIGALRATAEKPLRTPLDNDAELDRILAAQDFTGLL